MPKVPDALNSKLYRELEEAFSLDPHRVYLMSPQLKEQLEASMTENETQNTPPEPINPHRTVTELQSEYRLIFDRFLAGETIIEIAGCVPDSLIPLAINGDELSFIPDADEATVAVHHIINEEMKRLKARQLANG